MYWANRIVEEIINSGEYKTNSGEYKHYKVDDMFTPSGFAHIGSLRGPIIHDLVYKSLREKDQEAVFTYVFNDFDSLDGIPPGLEHLSKYLGFPLRKVPSPKENYESFAHFFTEDFKSVLLKLDVKPQFLSSWDLYHEGKFDEVIKIALDNAEKIQDIYQEVSGSKKKEKGWLPFQAICAKCGKLGTTIVYKWDGKDVSYKCEPEMVKWAEGCGHEGKVSPFGGTGKLPWKVDWPAHWKVLGVTIEGAGKDHASAGGSYDIAMEICKEVFNYPRPYKFAYEFFLVGGRKMSSSKGVGLQAKEFVETFPPDIVRFLFTRVDYRQAIDFNPIGTMAVPDLFDEYDRAQAQRGGSVFLPRFRDVANYLQLPNIDIKQKFGELKGSPLSPKEQRTLKEREECARIWLGKYAPEEYKFSFSKSLPDAAKDLTDVQKEYLERVGDLMRKEWSAEELQLELYSLAKELDLGTKEAFAAIYLSFTGKAYGPRAAWFLLQYPKEKVVKRLEEASGKEKK